MDGPLLDYSPQRSIYDVFALFAFCADTLSSAAKNGHDNGDAEHGGDGGRRVGGAVRRGGLDLGEDEDTTDGVIAALG